MTSSTISLTPVSGAAKTRNTLVSFVRMMRRNPMVAIGTVILVLWVLIGLFAPQIATHGILAQNVSEKLQAPSDLHHFGTDELGRDVFSRVLYGARITLPASIAVIVIGSSLGLVIGAVSGYLGGFWDEVITRLTELFMAFPTIILALAITAALGSDIRNAIVALVIVWWPSYARLIRGLVMEVKSRDFVEGTRSIGATRFYILFRTILPNTISHAIVLATIDIGSAILTFAGLSFLGLGSEPSSPEWGRMVSIGIDYFDQWWTWLYPGMAIATVVLAFNFIGDGLRDWLDPRTKR